MQTSQPMDRLLVAVILVRQKLPGAELHLKAVNDHKTGGCRFGRQQLFLRSVEFQEKL